MIAGIQAEKRDYFLYNLATVTRVIGIGIFVTIFNIYAMDAGFSPSFLGIFLSVGNISMSIASLPIGILIDKVSKKKLLILFSIIGGLCFLLQAIIINTIVLLIISAVYGISFIGLLNISGPFLKNLKILAQDKNLFVINRSLNLFSATAGSLLCGFLSDLHLSNQGILLIAGFLFLFSSFPLLLLKNDLFNVKSDDDGAKSRELNEHGNNSARINYPLLLICAFVFLFLGFAPLLTNYINLYFKNRFSLTISETSYIYAIINLLIGVVVLVFSKLKVHSIRQMRRNIFLITITIIALNLSLIFVESLMYQIIGVFLLMGLFESYYSLIVEELLSNTSNQIHGRISGTINLSANLSETFGIYLCGLLVSNNSFHYIFLLSAAATVFINIFIMILSKRIVTNSAKNGEAA